MPSLSLSNQWSSLSKFTEYQPHKEDLCTLCGANVGQDNMVECKDEIRICPDCIDLLMQIKTEKRQKKDEAAIEELMNLEKSMPDGYQPQELMQAIISAIRSKSITKLNTTY